MSSSADTSFLIALYFTNEHTSEAADYVERLQEPLFLSPIVQFEFQHAVWFDVFRGENGESNCIPRQKALSGLAPCGIDLDEGCLAIEPVVWPRLVDDAIELSTQYTLRHGIRIMDLLHLAAAKQCGFEHFLTFDKVQRKVAELEGFSVPL